MQELATGKFHFEPPSPFITSLEHLVGARAGSGQAAAAPPKADELAPFQWIEEHSVPPARPGSRISNWRGSVSGVYTPVHAARSRGQQVMKDGCRKPSFEQFGIGAIIAARGDQPATYLRACVACSWKTS